MIEDDDNDENMEATLEMYGQMEQHAKRILAALEGDTSFMASEFLKQQDNMIAYLDQIRLISGCPDDYAPLGTKNTTRNILKRIKVGLKDALDIFSDPELSKMTATMALHGHIIRGMFETIYFMQVIWLWITETGNVALREEVNEFIKRGIPEAEKAGVDKYLKEKSSKMRSARKTPKDMLSSKALELFEKAKTKNPAMTAYRFARTEKNIETLETYAREIGFDWNAADKVRSVEEWLPKKKG